MKEGQVTSVNGPEYSRLLWDSARICGSHVCAHGGWPLFLVLFKTVMPLHMDGQMDRFGKLLEEHIP